MARSWGGLVVRGLIVVAMGVVAPIVVVDGWAGAQAEPPTATTSATATTLATPPPPPPQPFEPCAGGSDVAQWQMRSGAMRVRATDSVFCFDGAGFGGASGMGAPMPGLTAPTLIPSELAENIFARPPGWLAFFALPEAFTGTGVRNSLGATLDWARTTNGRFAVAYDPDGPLNSTHFTFVGPNGDELARVPSRCGGPDIGRIDLPPANDGFGGLDPVTARVLLTPERFCLVVDTDQQPFELIWHYLELGPLRNVEAPTFDGASGVDEHAGALTKYLLPEAFPPFTVRDAAGTTLGSVRSPDGRRLLVFDPNATQGPFATATYRLIGDDGTVLATLANAPPDPCADAVPVAELELPNPAGSPAILSGPARVLAASGAMCVELVGDGRSGFPVYAAPFTPVPDLARPIIAGIGTGFGPNLGGFTLLIVPTGWPVIAEVRNEAGATLFAARHPDGRHLLVYDPFIDLDRLSRLPGEPLRYTLVGASGAVLAVVSSADQPEAPTPSTVASGALPATGRPIGPTAALAFVAVVLGLTISRRRTRTGPFRSVR